MHTHTIICHYNEISLKGKNRSFFENALIKVLRTRIQTALPDILDRVYKPWGAIFFDLKRMPTQQEEDQLIYIFQTTFGIANFALSNVYEQDIEQMKDQCLSLLKEEEFSTFRIQTRRSQKEFPLNSEEINRQVGAYVVDTLHKKVKLKGADIICHINFVESRALVYTKKYPGLGGLPHGTGGKVSALLSGGIDSPVAAYLALKKGMHLDMIHFHSLPYTSNASIQKVKKLAELLTPYQPIINLTLVPLAPIQRVITQKCQEKYRIILFRRFMMRIAEALCKRSGSQALVTGESLGQVASQTLENMSVIESVVDMPILRPLITSDKEEIMQLARKIDTLDTSNLPHDDCCTLFIPKHPETKAKSDLIERSEELLDIDTLIEGAIAKIEHVKIKA